MKVFKVKKFPVIISICCAGTISFFIFGTQFVSGQEKAPNVALYDVKGNRHILYSMLATLPDNGIVLLNFTSIYCPPCKKEIPELLSILHTTKRPCTILFIYSEESALIMNDIQSLNIVSNAFTDVLGNVKNTFAVKEVPTTILINKSAEIVGKFSGYSDSNIRAIKKIIVQ